MSGISFRIVLPITILFIFWLIPSPEGLSREAWHFSGIFLAVVAGLITEPVSPALIGFTGISLVAVLGLIGDPKESITWAISGFSNTVIWLIFAAFIFALGYKKTGLGKRISLIMIKYMGRSSLGLGYAVAFSDLILSPFMPSNTARSGGTVFPVVSNIPLIFNSTPDNEPQKLGAYIIWVGIASTCVTSSMFLTALAPNLLAVDIIEQVTGNNISWPEWAKIMLPLMIPLFLLTPWLVYIVFPPAQKHSPEAPVWADEELKRSGPVKPKEILMASLVIIALIFWIFNERIGMHPTTTAIAAVSVMALTGIITWDDIISKKEAFNILIWFASLVAMAAGLNKVGVLTWIGNSSETLLSDMSPRMIILSTLFLFFILHYFFASTTAHTTALLPIFTAMAVNMISPEKLVPFSILLAGSLGVMGILTPYATGPSPIWYGAGYISQPKWWALGVFFGIIYLSSIIIGSFIFL